MGSTRRPSSIRRTQRHIGTERPSHADHRQSPGRDSRLPDLPDAMHALSGDLKPTPRPQAKPCRRRLPRRPTGVSMTLKRPLKRRRTELQHRRSRALWAGGPAAKAALRENPDRRILWSLDPVVLVSGVFTGGMRLRGLAFSARRERRSDGEEADDTSKYIDISKSDDEEPGSPGSFLMPFGKARIFALSGDQASALSAVFVTLSPYKSAWRCARVITQQTPSRSRTCPAAAAWQQEERKNATCNTANPRKARMRILCP